MQPLRDLNRGNGATATTAFFDSRCGVERGFLSFHPPPPSETPSLENLKTGPKNANGGTTTRKIRRLDSQLQL